MTRFETRTLRLPETADTLRGFADETTGKAIWVVLAPAEMLDKTLAQQFAQAEGIPVVNLNKEVADQFLEAEDYETWKMAEKAGNPEPVSHAVADAIEDCVRQQLDDNDMIFVSHPEVALRYDVPLLPTLQQHARNGKKIVVLADGNLENEHLYIHDVEVETTAYTTIINLTK